MSYWEKGVPKPEVLARTSQDLAYAQLGLAMYYYLTRDEAVLNDIRKLKRHIFTQYMNPEWKSLRWIVKEGAEDEHKRQELVAQLDQINAYLLLLAPILPEPDRREWTEDLSRLAKVLVRDYLDAKQNLFWGTVHDPAQKKLGSRHTDFGHTAKAYWMLGRRRRPGLRTLAGPQDPPVEERLPLRRTRLGGLPHGPGPPRSAGHPLLRANRPEGPAAALLLRGYRDPAHEPAVAAVPGPEEGEGVLHQAALITF